MEEIRNYSPDQFTEFASKQMSNMNLVENLVLKAHVISEFVINCYLESISNKKTHNFFKENHKYATKLFLLESFGALPKESFSEVILSYKLLNKLRNEFAHTLKFNKNIFRDLMESIKRISPDDFNDRTTDDTVDLLSRMENISYLLSYLNGYVYGVFTVNRDS